MRKNGCHFGSWIVSLPPRPAHLEDFLDHSKPIIRYRKWEKDPNDSALVVGKQIWSPPIERIKLNRDYMIGR